MPKQKCKICGCTQERACPGGCYWVEEDLCSVCAKKITKGIKAPTVEEIRKDLRKEVENGKRKN